MRKGRFLFCPGPGAAREGRTIVFVDESGLLQRPVRKRTRAPEGRTPVLEFNVNWKKLPAIAGAGLAASVSNCTRARSKAPKSRPSPSTCVPGSASPSPLSGTACGLTGRRRSALLWKPSVAAPNSNNFPTAPRNSAAWNTSGAASSSTNRPTFARKTSRNPAEPLPRPSSMPNKQSPVCGHSESKPDFPCEYHAILEGSAIMGPLSSAVVAVPFPVFHPRRRQPHSMCLDKG
jgi:hypothetical protein